MTENKKPRFLGKGEFIDENGELRDGNAERFKAAERQTDDFTLRPIIQRENDAHLKNLVLDFTLLGVRIDQLKPETVNIIRQLAKLDQEKGATFDDTVDALMYSIRLLKKENEQLREERDRYRGEVDELGWLLDQYRGQ